MTPGNGYVLKFISGKYQGGEFPLEVDKEILIGRGSDLDMVLVEDMVSRRHARITTHDGDFMIEDMGSTNGTFVNGEKITTAKLKEGDRVLVGTSIIKLVAHDDEPTEEVSDLPDQAYHTPKRSAPTTATGAMSGKIEEVPLPDLLQLFASSRKSGVLVVTSDSEGRIYLRDGQVFHVTLEGEPDISPEKAFYRILWMKAGHFVLESDDGREIPEEPTIEASTESLMMEGMRQLDELENLAGAPPLEAVLTLSQPVIPPLRALSPELLDTLQLCINNRNLADILNRSLAPDLETMQDVVYLLDNGYLCRTDIDDDTTGEAEAVSNEDD